MCFQVDRSQVEDGFSPRMGNAQLVPHMRATIVITTIFFFHTANLASNVNVQFEEIKGYKTYMRSTSKKVEEARARLVAT